MSKIDGRSQMHYMPIYAPDAFEANNLEADNLEANHLLEGIDVLDLGENMPPINERVEETVYRHLRIQLPPREIQAIDVSQSNLHSNSSTILQVLRNPVQRRPTPFPTTTIHLEHAHFDSVIEAPEAPSNPPSPRSPHPLS